MLLIHDLSRLPGCGGGDLALCAGPESGCEPMVVWVPRGRKRRSVSKHPQRREAMNEIPQREGLPLVLRGASSEHLLCAGQLLVGMRVGRDGSVVGLTLRSL